MCDDDAIRELKQQIADAHVTEAFPSAELCALYELLWNVCPHSTTVMVDNDSVDQRTCCGKLLRRT